MIKELISLIDEHSEYCMRQYQQDNLQHMSMDQALEFQERMTQSLTHFSMWLSTVKSKEPLDK